MITVFMGMITVLIIVMGIGLPLWHWTLKGWKDSENKGQNPFIGGLFSAFLGYIIGFMITGGFLTMIGVLGYDVRGLACYFSTGMDLQMCQQSYGFRREGLENLSNEIGENWSSSGGSGSSGSSGGLSP